jgi:hypothetical protein
MDIKFKDNSQLRLAPFTQLEYIESTGTQYIDTGISFPHGFRTVAKLYPTNISSYKTIAGAYQPDLHNIHRIKNGQWNPCTQKNSAVLYGTVYVDTLYTVDMSNANGKYNLIVNENTLANNVSTPTGYSSLTCWLFAVHRTDDADYHYYYGRIYEISLYDENNVLKFHGIPALDRNNVVCMYDTVSQNLFYNQGTGDFVAGPVSENQPYISLPDDIKLKITSIFHQNTPNVNALSLINDVVNYQKTHQDEVVLLNRIRADIGNVEGSLLGLMELAGMAGFNDNYEPQAKPRLVGTYTINDWYTSEQLAEAQATFDGITIVPDPNYLINFDNLAVQVLDNTQPNYNPGMAIVLQKTGHGVTFDTPVISGQTGRWMLTKVEASDIRELVTLKNRATVTDTNGIVGEVGVSYNQTNLDFSDFGIVHAGDWCCEETTFNCPLILPSTITTLYQAFYNSNFTYIRILATNPPTIRNTDYTFSKSYKIYVGDGSSAESDDIILQNYNNGQYWNRYSSRLDTWYNYLHPSA